MQFVREWFRRNLSDPQVVILSLLLLIGSLIVLFMGKILAPVLASVIIAYLLEGIVGLLERWRVPRFPAVMVVFCVFITFQIVALFALLPMLSR